MWAARFLRTAARASVAATVGACSRVAYLHAATDAAPLGEDHAESSDPDPKSSKCLHMTLHDASVAEVLRLFPATGERELGERVLLRPCISEEVSDVQVRVLAYAQDDWTQSLLVALSQPLWPADEVPEGGVGYAVLPISVSLLASSSASGNGVGRPEVEPTGAHDPAPKADALESEGSTVSEGSQAADSAEALETATVSPWDMTEGLWRRLEAHGVLLVERDENALPARVSLVGGATEWTGSLASEWLGTAHVEVKLVSGLVLNAQTAVPECGFCKFMKAGPCAEAFTAWESCIDRARDSSKDFVELCGAQTMLLKECTDKHPEYYGMLSEGDAADEEEKQAPPKDNAS